MLDRFHIIQKFDKTLDKVRTEEAKRLCQEKQPAILSKSHWCFFKRHDNLTEKQSLKLKELLKMNLKTVKAYILRKQFQKFWEYRPPYWVGKFLVQWCHIANFNRIDSIKEITKMLTSHRTLILNYFRAKNSLTVVS